MGGLTKAPDPFCPGVNTYADYCLVYNYFSSWTAPSSCPTTPTPPSSGTGNNGNVRGYFYQDGVNTGFGHTMKYTYDNVNRLTEDQTTSGPSLTQLYNYIGDGSNGQFGNMTCTSGCANMPVNLAFNVANNQINSPNYTYDLAGNLTTDASNSTHYTYQWDAEGRVWSVVNGATTTWSFTYDANGDRVTWVSGGVTYDHLFDPAGNWLGVAGSYSIAMLGIRPLTIYTSGETWFHHLNNIGLRTMMTAHWGNVTQDMVFYPFGGLWQNSGSGGLEFADLPYRDTTTNIDLTMFRVSSPNLGRWHSPDPMGGDITNPQSLNRYAYVANNPATSIDPLGLDGQTACGPMVWGPEGGPEGIGGWDQLCVAPPDPEQQAPPDDLDGGGSSDYVEGGAMPDDFWGMSQLANLPFANAAANNDARNNPCTQPILDAVNNQFGTNATWNDIQGDPFTNGNATNLNIQLTGLPAGQFNSIQTGRYPANWLTYLSGYGPYVHVTGSSYFDPTATFANSNIGGNTIVLFTAHIDYGYLLNPFGALYHLIREVFQIGGPRGPC